MQFDKAVNASWLEAAYAWFSTGLSTDFVDKVREKWRNRVCYVGNLLTWSAAIALNGSLTTQ